MSYASRSSVVAFSNAKQASLYCEHVVPLELMELMPVRGSEEPQVFDILQQVLPPSLVDAGWPRSVHPGVMAYTAEYLVAFPQWTGTEGLPTGETFEARAKKHLPQLHAHIAQVV